MRLCINDLLYAFSDALDCVEKELVGVSNFHARRIACLAVWMGRGCSFSDEQLLELTAATVLHDNALTEYIQTELRPKQEYAAGKGVSRAANFGEHCRMGERNVMQLPFYDKIKGAILYHHENSDGSGPFKKTAAETPFFAQLIHLADMVDVHFHLDSLTEKKYADILAYLDKNSGSVFSEELVALFKRCVSYENMLKIQGENASKILRDCLPVSYREYSEKNLMGLAAFFARITDYKSRFTSSHSLGIAEKARQMGKFYGLDSTMCVKLYLAGALHDIGKLIITNDILEKPGKLTEEEYKNIQNHAYATYKILSAVEGLEDITSWASFHHETLDGAGYPFGKKASELGKFERLLACLDIYQALTERRPYKDGMSHAAAVKILQSMVDRGKLDGSIVRDIDTYFGTFAQPHALSA